MIALLCGTLLATEAVPAAVRRTSVGASAAVLGLLLLVSDLTGHHDAAVVVE